MKQKMNLATEPRRMRILSAKTAVEPDQITRDGGMYGAGLIEDVAVVTRGEALGHGMWVDHVMLEQVASGINARERGVKSRFAHPGLSGDGLGKLLGRVVNGRVDGDITRGDLHLAASAAKSPDGDLAGYVMSLAVEDSEAFGMSIVFEEDIGEQDRFVAEHEDKDGNFISPDEANISGYPHARVAELLATDAVDEPAANPAGLFHRQDWLLSAEAVASYALGLCDEMPAESFLDIHPARLRSFVAGLLERNGYKLITASEHKRLQSALQVCRQTLELR